MPSCLQVSAAADQPDHHEHPSELNWDFVYLAYDVLIQLVRKFVNYVLFICSVAVSTNASTLKYLHF